MARDKQGKPDKELTPDDLARLEAKAKAKAERLSKEYEYQRGEESTAWAEINQQADKAIQAYKARGRPAVHDWTAIQTEILDRLANGQSLASICQHPHMPEPSTIYERLRKDPSFAQDYARARGNLADILFDQCLMIADDESRDVVEKDGEITVNNAAIARDRLRIETRMRMAGKLSGKYADKPSFGDSPAITVNSLTVNARDLPPDDRQRLREMLIQARDRAGTVIDG